MNLKRAGVFAVFAVGLVLGPAGARAQAQGNPERIAQLEAQLGQVLATIGQLQSALTAETAARQAADGALQANIDALSGGGVTQAALDAAIGAEAAARVAFDSTLASVSALAPYVTVSAGTIDDLAGPHIIFTGANVHIRSGHPSGNSYTENGRGNLILGYNEPSDPAFPSERRGSHNLVIGPNHRYDFGVGLVVGGSSRLGSHGASVSGGFMNTASGFFASVSGGIRNEARGDFAAAGGGADNVAAGTAASVAAGQLNQATNDLSSVSGGFNNQATGIFSTVGGGSSIVNAVPFTFVP